MVGFTDFVTPRPYMASSQYELTQTYIRDNGYPIGFGSMAYVYTAGQQRSAISAQTQAQSTVWEFPETISYSDFPQIYNDIHIQMPDTPQYIFTSSNMAALDCRIEGGNGISPNLNLDIILKAYILDYQTHVETDTVYYYISVSYSTVEDDPGQGPVFVRDFAHVLAFPASETAYNPYALPPTAVKISDASFYNGILFLPGIVSPNFAMMDNPIAQSWLMDSHFYQDSPRIESFYYNGVGNNWTQR